VNTAARVRACAVRRASPPFLQLIMIVGRRRRLLGDRLLRLRGDRDHDRGLTFATRTAKANQRCGQRLEQAHHRLERWQEELEDALGALADDCQRQDVLAHHDEQHHRANEHRKTTGEIDAGDTRDQARGDHGEQRQQNARRNEQSKRILEIAAQGILAAAALRHQPQREPHQRAERGRHGAHVDDGEPDQKQQEGRHRLRVRRDRLRSMSPSLRPAAFRRRASARVISPWSRSWS
jgi:hypothetical protein